MATRRLPGQRSDRLVLAPHPDAPTQETLTSWAAGQAQAGRPIAIDLFSGAGGLSAGIESAGWAVAAAVDLDRRALETHAHNFPGLALQLDLGEGSVRDAFIKMFKDITVDLVAGGPPCQPFSRAGRSKIRSLVEAGQRDEVDARRELWRAFLDVALRLKPRAILMENVPDMGLGDDFAVVRYIVDRLESTGYVTDVRLADAWKFGVPQHRKRLILLARNDGHPFTWPTEQGGITTLREAIGDLPRLDGGTGRRDMTYWPPKPASGFAGRIREGAPSGVLHDHMTRGVRDDDREIFKLMDSKTLYSDIPADLRRYKADSFTDKYKRLGWEELSRSITAHIAKDGYWYIHPSEHRTLTVREAARIQTFPDRFRFSGTRSDAFRQIGNAVPPLLGEAAANAVAPRDGAGEEHGSAWLEARRELAKWGKRQRSSEHWFMVPGPSVTPPVALAAAAMSSVKQAPNEVGNALDYLRGLAYFNTEPLESALDAASIRGKKALDRLRPLARKRAIWANPDEAALVAGLNDKERQVFELLQGKDVVLRSQGVLRLSARVAGRNSHEVNRGTDGRLDLARLVGSGQDAAIRMAAIRLLASTRCTSERQDCDGCPLAAWCVTRQTEVSAAQSR